MRLFQLLVLSAVACGPAEYDTASFEGEAKAELRSEAVDKDRFVDNCLDTGVGQACLDGDADDCCKEACEERYDCQYEDGHSSGYCLTHWKQDSEACVDNVEG